MIVNGEDGRLYRWDLTTNTFTQTITLEPDTGEAYTPTFIGPDGTVYAIDDAVLHAVGKALPPFIVPIRRSPSVRAIPPTPLDPSSGQETGATPVPMSVTPAATDPNDYPPVDPAQASGPTEDGGGLNQDRRGGPEKSSRARIILPSDRTREGRRPKPPRRTQGARRDQFEGPGGARRRKSDPPMGLPVTFPRSSP